MVSRLRSAAGRLLRLLAKPVRRTGSHGPIVIETFRGYMGPNNRFTLEFVAEIPLTPSGKRRFFISEVIEGTGSTLDAEGMAGAV